MIGEDLPILGNTVGSGTVGRGGVRARGTGARETDLHAEGKDPRREDQV